MHFKSMLGDTVPKYLRLSKTEAMVLDTIITTKSGNAYRLWKTLGLKHYPTVLRTIKKLEEKRLVQVLSESGKRGERIYAPTLVGTLVSHIYNGEEKKIVEIVAENSSLYRELTKIEKDVGWAFFAVRDILFDMYRDRTEVRGIDEAVKSSVKDHLLDRLLNIDEEGAFEWIIKASKVKWIRQLAIRETENERVFLRRRIKELGNLAKKLEQLYWLNQYSKEEESV